MIPVRLRLRNFLSYGEDPPVLDFSGFHVACLSGGNGQGKSALLDAMTWAIWGEARKSAEARKPDEELLRTGAREMEVDFSFALDGEGYRVVRRFTQTASGKTSKPGLEFQASDGAGGWIALTAESVRATQAVIDARLGVDYETFVNSTFLLQGRSDEFTRKKPGERKQILTRILGLDRYERLAASAAASWSALGTRLAALDAEAARLADATADAAAWEAEREAVAGALEQTAADLAATTAALADADARLAALDAAAREADALDAALADLAARRAAADAEAAALGLRIDEATALVARAPEVEAEHARYEALRARRAELDERAALWRGLDAQRQRLEVDERAAMAKAETDLARLDADLDALRARVAEGRARLGRREEVQGKLAAARAAEVERDALARTRETRRAAEQAVAGADTRLAAERGALTGHLAALRQDLARLDAEAARDAPDDRAALTAAVAGGRAAEAETERVRAEGQAAAEAVAGADARVAALDAEAAALDARRARVEARTEAECPACGTALTDEHRAHALGTVDARRAEVERLATAEAAARDAAVRRRDALRARYLALRPAVEAGAAAAARLAALDEREAQRAARAARRAALAAEVVRAEADLAADAFLPAVRAERAAAQDVLDAHPLDAARFETVAALAAGREHLAAQLRDLDRTDEAVRALVNDGTRKRAERERLAAAVAAGEPAAEPRRRLAQVREQAAAVGYDAAEHERTATDLAGLADAPAALARLLDARRSLAEWTERRAALRAESARLAADAAARASALNALRARLAARPAAQAERAALDAERARLDAERAAAQARLGGLDERLARAAADRAALAVVRRDARDAKRERGLYTHLKRAFGKDGIPSLILEETLPEVEARANEVLERVSGGQTRVVLETLRDKKTGGGTRETLEIRITDATGVARAYETYSGGEAFRVNFALRIALAQLLAERAGTRIRTLVVDEGFGTQDPEGLQSLVGAIRAVQDDFDKILVVTHLDELKAAFPVRIEVRKEAVTGSTFDVVGV